MDETVADVRPRVNRILVWAEEVSGIKAAIAIAKSVSPINFFIIFSFTIVDTYLNRLAAGTTRKEYSEINRPIFNLVEILSYEP